MATGKFHINEQHEARPCNATVRPCRFGAEDHFTSKAAAAKEAEKRMGKEHKTRLRSQKKKAATVPATHGLELLQDPHASASDKADVLIFEALKEAPDAARYRPAPALTLGEVEEDYYASCASAKLPPELARELVDHGAAKWAGNTARDRAWGEKQGNAAVTLADLSSVRLVPGTLTDGSTLHFDGTDMPSETAYHLEARAVVTCPDGHQVEVPVMARGGFSDFLSKTVEVGERHKANRNVEREVEDRVPAASSTHDEQARRVAALEALWAAQQAEIRALRDELRSLRGEG